MALFDFLNSMGGQTPMSGMNPDMKNYLLQQGLLGAGLGLLQAGAPSTTPQNWAGALGQGLSGFMGGQARGMEQLKALQGMQPQIKPVDLPSMMDEFLTTKFGSKYSYGDVNTKKTLLDWVSTSEGRKEYEDYMAKVNASKQPSFNFLPTTEGYMAVSTKEPTKQIGLGFGKPVPETVTAKQADLKTSIDLLDRIESGLKSDYVGPYKGRIGQLTGKIADLPPEQAELYANMANYGDTLLRLRSGAAITDAEYKRMLKFIPSAEDTLANAKSKIRTLKVYLNDVYSRTEKEFEKSGHAKPKSKVRRYNPSTGRLE